MTHKEYLQKIGIEIRVARIRKKITILQLSELAKLSERTILQLENGKDDGHIITYKRIADALEMDLKDLL